MSYMCSAVKEKTRLQLTQLFASRTREPGDLIHFSSIYLKDLFEGFNTTRIWKLLRVTPLRYHSLLEVGSLAGNI